jgi:hypothetical protein
VTPWAAFHSLNLTRGPLCAKDGVAKFNQHLLLILFVLPGSSSLTIEDGRLMSTSLFELEISTITVRDNSKRVGSAIGIKKGKIYSVG